MNLFILLQESAAATVEMATQVAPTELNYFGLILKGGWILLPIFLLSLLSIYVIITKFMYLNRVGKKDTVWMSRVVELVYDGKSDKALKFCIERPYASAKVVAAGLKEIEYNEPEIQQSMEVEARQQVVAMENQMNWLGITASIAPMLGFLGTIFGVIRIFYDVASTGEYSIDIISAGLYEKMICSGAGLLVGILAYSGYYLLNGRIDKLVATTEKDANEILKVVRSFKKHGVQG